MNFHLNLRNLPSQLVVLACLAGATAGVAAAVPSKPSKPTLVANVNGLVTIQSTVTSDGGSGLTKWQYQQKKGEDDWNGWRDIVATSWQLIVSLGGFENGAIYRFKVRAWNKDGHSEASDESDPVTIPATTPSKPTQVSVQAGNASVRLSWTQGSDGGGKLHEWQYTQKADEGNYGGWIEICRTSDESECPDTTSHTVNNLTNGTAYKFKVRAVNGIGNGGESDESDSVTPSTTPEKPTSLAVSAASEAVNLSWTAGGNGGSAIESWKYTQKTGSNLWSDWSDVPNSGASTTNYTVTGLSSVVSYKFKVRAVNANGDGAESDESTSVSPLAAVLNATSVEATTASLNIANYSGSWHYKYTGGDCSNNAVSTKSVALSSLTGNTSYTFKAYSDNSCNTELATASAFLTKPGKPDKPTATAGVGSGKLTLASSVTGNGTLTKWKYQQKEGSGNYGSWQEISSTSATLSHAVTGLTDGTDYQFKVLAVNATGEGLVSDESTKVQPLVEMLTPSSVEATTATLAIGNYTGDWYYKRTTPSAGICSSKLNTGTKTSIDLTGLTGNTNYTFKAYSDISCATELAQSTFLTKPDKPTTPTAAAGSGSGKLLLTSSVTGDGTLGMWQYKRKEGSGQYDSNWRDISFTETTLAHTVTGLTDNIDYQFKVRAVNASGEGEESDESTAAEPVPETLQVTQVTQSSAKLILGGRTAAWWYQGNQDGATCESVGQGATEVVLDGLNSNTEYTYTVYSQEGCSNADAIVSVKFTTEARTGGVDGGSGGTPSRPTPDGPACPNDRPFVVGIGLASDPGFDDRYKAGDAIIIALTYSHPVTVFGSGPRLQFSLGGEARTAEYAGGAGTTALSFRYLVAEGDAGELGIPTDALAGNTGKVHNLCGLGATLDIEASALPYQVGGPLHVPLLPPASDAGRQGFVRVINHSDEAGEVAVTAIDDAGTRVGPVTLAIGARASTHFNTTDLEDGNDAKGLSGGTGIGQGNWRLEVESDLEIEALGYVRHADGFLTAMGSVAPRQGGMPWVATFNPSSNYRQVSRLRLFNASQARAAVSVTGMDDLGQSPGGAVKLDLAAGAAAGHDADALESGTGIDGALGDGTGKWRLTPEAIRDVAAMSLMESPSGHLTNLSTAPANRHGDVLVLPLFLSAADPHQRQGFARIINHSDRAGTVSIQAFDDSAWEYAPLTLSISAKAAVHFNSDDLELGNPGKGLEGSTGAASAGNWWLSLTSDLDIEALAYVRHKDGFLTSMHDVAPKRLGIHRVATFNPASNYRQVSQLRIVNLGADPAQVTIKGIDGNGQSPGTDVAVTVPIRRSLTLDAKALEEGGDGFEGALGDGASKWRLEVESEQLILVMSLMQSPTHHLTNLSSRPLRPD